MTELEIVRDWVLTYPRGRDGLRPRRIRVRELYRQYQEDMERRQLAPLPIERWGQHMSAICRNPPGPCRTIMGRRPASKDREKAVSMMVNASSIHHRPPRGTHDHPRRGHDQMLREAGRK